MNIHTLRVVIDVGSTRHRVAVGLPDGTLIDEFDIDHHTAGFNQFFRRIAGLHILRRRDQCLVPQLPDLP